MLENEETPLDSNRLAEMPKNDQAVKENIQSATTEAAGMIKMDASAGEVPLLQIIRPVVKSTDSTASLTTPLLNTSTTPRCCR